MKEVVKYLLTELLPLISVLGLSIEMYKVLVLMLIDGYYVMSIDFGNKALVYMFRDPRLPVVIGEVIIGGMGIVYLIKELIKKTKKFIMLLKGRFTPM